MCFIMSKYIARKVRIKRWVRPTQANNHLKTVDCFFSLETFVAML